MPIYLDHSATTPLAPEVREAMLPFLTDAFGNAASIHSYGREAAAALDEAHYTVGCAIGARASEIVFTGCGTESDNLALRGVMLALRQRNSPRRVLVTAPTEHHAIEATARQLEQLFGFELVMLPVDGDAWVNPDAVRRLLNDRGSEIGLVSVMMANNEVGTLQSVAEIGAHCRAFGVPFHTDAVQCPAWLPIDVGSLNIDLMTMSAHKFYGPKGVGVLYLRDGVPFISTATGGGHERDRRAGTVNVAGAVATAAALKMVSKRRASEAVRVGSLRDRLIEGVLACVPDARLTGHPERRLPHHASFAFNNIDGETLMMALDVEGIAVSTGSACTSGNPEPSPVLVAMGVPPEWALGGLRISLGYGTTDADIDAVLERLPVCVARVRASADFVLRPRAQAA